MTIPRSDEPTNGRTPARWPRLLWVSLLLLLAGVAVFAMWPRPPERGNLEGSSIGGPFTLVDQNGRTVSSDSFADQWRLMYFGFTYCPDICPTDMAKIAAAMRQFGSAEPAHAASLVPLFVTVDPERDTPDALRQFTAAFHPRILGLTGSREQVDAALKTFRIYARRVPQGDSYTMDHLAVIYLFDAEGRPVAFQAGMTATPDSIAAMLKAHIR